MGLFEKIEEHKEGKEEPGVVWVDAPETPGQKWFREEAERRRDELTKNDERK